MQEDIPVYVEYRESDGKLVPSKDYTSSFTGRIGYATPVDDNNQTYNVKFPVKTDYFSNIRSKLNVMKNLDITDFKTVTTVHDILSFCANNNNNYHVIYIKRDNTESQNIISSNTSSSISNVYATGKIFTYNTSERKVHLEPNVEIPEDNGVDIPENDILVIYDTSGVVTMNDNVIINFFPVSYDSLNFNYYALFKDGDTQMFLCEKSMDNDEIDVIWFVNDGREKKYGLDNIWSAYELLHVQQFFSWRFDHRENKPPIINDKTKFQILKDPDDYEMSRDDKFLFFLLSFFKNKRYYEIYKNNCEEVFQNIKKYFSRKRSQSFGYQTMYDILRGKKTKLSKSISSQQDSSTDNYIISIINK